MLNGLSLFSGIGGIELALQDWVKTVAYCEIDPYAQAVLRSRMQKDVADTSLRELQRLRFVGKQVVETQCKEGQSYGCSKTITIDPAPIFPDITKLTATDLPQPIDIITGGFPCQDISNAGKRAGIQGKRSGLWFEMHRLIGELRPSYVFVENVSALLNRGLPEVLASLAEIGYDAVWTSIRASDVGAPHRRERVFILAYPNSQRCKQRSDTQREYTDILSEVGQAEESKQPRDRWECGVGEVCESSSWWDTDPADLDPKTLAYVGRVADGIPCRVDRIKCLGNAVVPQQAREAFIRLMQIKGGLNQ